MGLKEDINFFMKVEGDFIERDFLETRFKDFMKNGIIQGATSNPAILNHQLQTLLHINNNLICYKQTMQKQFMKKLALTDIKRAAFLLRNLHKNDADDGFISIEVDPLLCDDAAGTIEEGVRLLFFNKCW